ncbi:unnamed protein product [Laminaria digitata]
MGGHARHIGLPGEHVPIHVGELHKNLGTVYLTTMFLWMMYRAKQDGLVLLVRVMILYDTSSAFAVVVVSVVLHFFLVAIMELLLFSVVWQVQHEPCFFTYWRLFCTNLGFLLYCRTWYIRRCSFCPE